MSKRGKRSRKNKTGTQRIKMRRDKLYAIQEGKCYWCHRFMIPTWQHSGGKQPNALCTIDHLDEKFTPYRGKYKNISRTVAACFECNQKRAIRRKREYNEISIGGEKDRTV